MQTLLGLPWWGWLSLTYPAYAWWTWKHPKVWIPIDVKAFDEDGSNQSLGQVFHRQRGTWRIVGAALPAILIVWILGYCLQQFWVVLLPLVALVVMHGAYWVWYFNPNLSRARKLDYIDTWHVSWAANASYLDKHVWTAAWELVYPNKPLIPGEYDLQVAVKSRDIYPGILRGFLRDGIIAFIFFHILFFLLK